jgi:twinkle protein
MLREAILEAKQWLGIATPTFEPVRRKNWKKPQLKIPNVVNQQSAVKKYLTAIRKLTEETLTKYRIQDNDNEIIFPYYRDGELIFVKYLKLDRPDGKKQIRVQSDCEPCLFGWDAIPKDARSVAIVEGEIDAMTLDQYQLGLAVLSVPFGGGNGNKQEWIQYEFDRLSVFDEIYLCLDNDDAGKKATDELIERLGRYRCRIVKLPYKDANECLQNGLSSQEIRELFDQAQILDPAELKQASSYVNEVIQQFYPPEQTREGYDFPWDKTHNKIYLRPDELSVWTGINGHGKSQLLGYVMLHCIKQGAKVCIASLELKPKRLLARLTRQAAGIKRPSDDYIRAIHDWYEDKLWIFDLVGTAKKERLLEVFKYARQRYGVDVFVIDSFMKCGIAEDEYNSQKLFIEELCDFKNEHNCQVHLVVHPRKGVDESKIPGKLDMKGSGSITDLADNCFTVWRNKPKEEAITVNKGVQPLSEQEKPDCVLVVISSEMENGKVN